MVSIVGMATLVEDFDTQDCKKRKKEGDHAPVKTITNYFMPLAKVEKAFSPPKSNNIMDYFKKTSPANNKHVVQEKVKENQEKRDVTVKDDRIPVRGVRSLRRGRNVTKKENFSKQIDSIEENTDEVSDVNNDSRDNGLTVGSSILGSETAALLAEICANSYDLQEDKNLNEQPKTALKSKTMKKTKKMQRKPQQLETSSKVLIKEPLENKDSNESSRVTLLPPHNECRKSMCNSSLDVNVDETSCLNDSIVTISFEDFLESQKEVDNLSSPDRSLVKSSDDKDGQKSSPSQVSPRTLTIQAQVHSLAARSTGAKAQKKIASIFMKKRDVEADPVEVLQVDPLITKTAEQVSKRKSNVVVDEEALELSVIETSTSCLSKPKCTPAEKKQFMNVFKQPPLDVAKNKQKKVQRNPKVPIEKVPKELEVTENTTEETAVRNVLDSDVSGSSGNWTDAKKNTLKAKQLVEKAKAMQQSKCKTTQDKDVCLRRSSRARQQSKVTPDEVYQNTQDICFRVCFTEMEFCRSSLISAVMTFLDESENSQDDEQFRAKREFLKSGLPDSFKKHIAKKAASELAFSQAAVSFRAVVHILQKQEGMFSFILLYLCCIGMTYCVCFYFFALKVSGWRVDLSEEMRQQLLEDIRLANPSFPVQKFFNWFLKRRTEHVYFLLYLVSHCWGFEKTRSFWLFLKADASKEDVLWTEKYQPQQSSEIVGNCGAIKKLYSWLKEWKLRTDCEESKNQTESKLKDKNDFKEDDSEEENDDFLCNTMLVTGPSGVGKTAAVYACAHELGFKVFEVNASSQRSGRQVLSQLKEATQSHQVDIQGVNTHKPAYFSNPSRSFSGSSTSPRKLLKFFRTLG
uniref:ATPase AAA-type core domain-containing protein n=1 Tax=Erpetoichthys calabaricus TaxID=27687 RepID=A0A8C4SZS9_ERPCA